MIPFPNKPVLQPLTDPLFKEKNLNVFVLRDDLIHPYISGNKWRKLKYNIEEFRKEGKEYLVTFGGAYSNHITATAAAGKELGIKTIGVIRGEEHGVNTNPVLRFAHACGMKLIFISREKYRCLRENNSLPIPALKTPDSQLYFLPEGGSNDLAVKGCKEIVDDIPIRFDVICCACGTGATLAGIVNGLKDDQRAIGIAVLKGASFLKETVISYGGSENNFQIVPDYVFGGYAKSTIELEEFCKTFTEQHHIPVEWVYTGKLFFGIYDLVKKDFFERGKTIVVVHTGGIYDFRGASFLLCLANNMRR